MGNYTIQRVSSMITVNVVAVLLRQADTDEVTRMGYKNGFEAVLESVRSSSDDCYIVHDKITMTPFCIFGVSLTTGVTPAPWLLCTDKINTHKRGLLKKARPIIDAFKDKYKHLSNYVSIDNDNAIKFIHHLGFEFGSIVNFNGNKFINFTMEKK